MSLNLINSLIAWALVLIPLMFTPGPTNILLTSSGATVGFIQSLPFIIGVNIGIILVLLSVALGVSHFLYKHPFMFDAIHYFGVIYMLYLAYKFFVSSKKHIDASINHLLKFTVINGLFIEVLNPKVWLSLIVIFVAFTKSNPILMQHILFLITLTVFLNIIDNLLWLVLGSHLIGKIFSGPLAKTQNYFLGLLLVGVSCWILIR